jgi:peptidoglycan/LPS O-acetylase OafA/YrhL
MWMLPYQMKDFSQSLVAVSLFASNILFWQESGYFAAAAEKPLLHTWSLAVEEQYYVLFPIFLILAWRFGKNRVFWMIVVMASISLLSSEWGWRNKASANFYLAPFRAWELFAGSIAAFIVQKQGVQKNNTLALLGLAAIVFSLFFYDETTPFPSVYALVPVIGVVLLVLYANKDTFAAKLLSYRGLVGIGLISYSAYLWHQPLFAFNRLYLNKKADIYMLGMPAPKASTVAVLAIVLVTFMLAFVTYKWIETPLRKPNSWLSKRLPKWYVWSIIGIGMFFSYGLYTHYNFKESLVNNIKLSATWSEDVRQYECLLQGKQQEIHSTDCFSDTHEVVLWGDSHGASLSPGMRKVLEEVDLGFTQLTQSGCGPLANLEELNHRKNCNIVNEQILINVLDYKFENIILHAAWLHADYPINLDSLSDHLNPIVNGVRSRLQNSNIIIVGAVPRWQRDPRFHEVSSENGKILYSDSALLLTDVNRALKEYSVDKGIVFVDPSEVFCPNYAVSGECILALRDMETSGWLGVTIDYAHLSSEASLLLANAVKPFLVKLGN